MTPGTPQLSMPGHECRCVECRRMRGENVIAAHTTDGYPTRYHPATEPNVGREGKRDEILLPQRSML